MREETQYKVMELQALGQSLLGRKKPRYPRQEEQLGIYSRNLLTVSIFTTFCVIQKVWDTHQITNNLFWLVSLRMFRFVPLLFVPLFRFVPLLQILPIQFYLSNCSKSVIKKYLLKVACKDETNEAWIKVSHKHPNKR